ncbi:hypothetical protein QFC20_002493 [Naganishia adeliensis]|uniref:Uncharacterized protein n=1 Tax=Naganishia adeliensis TaxID=92952 RepID=A0ACC2WL30_9TREE|nr:hypothetical protein QFC20_002493 [Naganishia adeliensis]
MAPFRTTSASAATLNRRVDPTPQPETSDDATILGMTPTTLAGVAIVACLILALAGWLIYRKVTKKFRGARNLANTLNTAQKDFRGIPGNGKSKVVNLKEVAGHGASVGKAYKEVARP